jgi:hypothetical protein
VSIVIHQHIQKCEIRQKLATEDTKESGKFRMSQLEKFAESNFMIPDYVYHFVRAPISRMGFLYGIHKVTKVVTSPSPQDIHTFLSDLFTKALLSAECSIGKETLHGIRLCGQIPIHLSCICFLYSVLDLCGAINGGGFCSPR